MRGSKCSKSELLHEQQKNPPSLKLSWVNCLRFHYSLFLYPCLTQQVSPCWMHSLQASIGSKCTHTHCSSHSKFLLGGKKLEKMDTSTPAHGSVSGALHVFVINLKHKKRETSGIVFYLDSLLPFHIFPGHLTKWPSLWISLLRVVSCLVCKGNFVNWSFMCFFTVIPKSLQMYKISMNIKVIAYFLFQNLGAFCGFLVVWIWIWMGVFGWGFFFHLWIYDKALCLLVWKDFKECRIIVSF